MKKIDLSITGLQALSTFAGGYAMVLLASEDTQKIYAGILLIAVTAAGYILRDFVKMSKK